MRDKQALARPGPSRKNPFDSSGKCGASETIAGHRDRPAGDGSTVRYLTPVSVSIARVAFVDRLFRSAVTVPGVRR